MKHKRISVSDHKKVSDIATIASYGLEWADTNGDSGADYELGGVETVAHQISCCLYQWFRPRVEMDTGDTRDYLKLEEFPTRDRIEARLVKLIEQEQQKGK